MIEPTPIQREAIPHLIAGRTSSDRPQRDRKDRGFRPAHLERLPNGRMRSPPQPGSRAHPGVRDPGGEAIERYGPSWEPGSSRFTAVSRSGDNYAPWNRGSTWSSPLRAAHLTTSGGRPDLKSLTIVVLDEADEILDMGFAEDIEAILDRPRPAGRPCCSPRPCQPDQRNRQASPHDPVRILIEMRTPSPVRSPDPPKRLIVSRAVQAGRFSAVCLDVETPRFHARLLPDPRGG